MRWYVEGETEFYAAAEILAEPSKFGIELVDLRGVITSDKDNIALKLGDWLRQDRELKRFSIISFDRDLGTNEKIIRRQVEQGNVVGLINAHEPDFEFANFSIGELVEIAARLDEARGFPANALRNEDWTDIRGCGESEKRYGEVSAGGSLGLKGESGAEPWPDTPLNNPVVQTMGLSVLSCWRFEPPCLPGNRTTTTTRSTTKSTLTRSS